MALACGCVCVCVSLRVCVCVYIPTLYRTKRRSWWLGASLVTTACTTCLLETTLPFLRPSRNQAGGARVTMQSPLIGFVVTGFIFSPPPSSCPPSPPSEE